MAGLSSEIDSALEDLSSIARPKTPEELLHVHYRVHALQARLIALATRLTVFFATPASGLSDLGVSVSPILYLFACV